jgi:feruloyl esterase
VERGVAPEAILATKYVNDNPAQGVARAMPLCTFPEEARYDGAGDSRDAAGSPTEYCASRVDPAEVLREG